MKQSSLKKILNKNNVMKDNLYNKNENNDLIIKASLLKSGV